MYEAITRDIRLRVTPQFLEDESQPEVGRYLWAYTVIIENESSETVQLRSRYWHITDARGRVQEVSGPGVVGEQPFIEAGSSYSYSSACPLKEACGMMIGIFHMLSESGEAFDIDVPAFSLDSPDGRSAII